MSIDLKAVSAVAIRRVNLCLSAGSLTLVVGKTGAGKSTLLRCISGLERPTEGDIVIDGTPLWKSNRVQIQAIQNLTMVFQSPEQQLFATSVKKEFEYSLRPCRLAPDVAQQRIGQAMETVCMPMTLLDVAPKALSGGQQRRVAIATALATQPAWLLLDEPTAGLDAPAAQSLSMDIRKMADAGQGVIVATHDLDVWLPLADRLLIMQNGNIAADLKAAEAMENPELLADSDVGLPASAQCSAYLWQRGWDICPGALSPAEAAQQIIRNLERAQVVPVAAQAQAQATQVAQVPQVPQVPQVAKRDFRRLVIEMDARAKWFTYALLSVVILTVPIAGILPSTAAVLFLAVTCRVPFIRFWHVSRPFLIFMAFTVVFSGLTWPIGYSVPHGIRTLLSLVRILLILMLGVWFTDLTSALEMKRGLEMALSWLKPFQVPVEAIAFGASLVLRFIPILGAEAKKFAEVSQIRAKRIGRGGQVRLREAPTLLMPLLFSLFQLGEDLSFAMEARGFIRFGMPRTSGSTVNWGRRDTLFTLSALMLSALVVVVSLVVLPALGL